MGFAVVWLQFSGHRVWPFSALTLKNHHLHEKYGRFLDAVHVVHPSWSVRLLRLALWPFAGDEFWDQFQCHERVEFLDSSVNLKKLALPADVIAYDKFLDVEAEEMSKNAHKTMSKHWGGYNPMMQEDSQSSSQQYKEQMDDIQNVLSQKGYSKKSD